MDIGSDIAAVYLSSTTSSLNTLTSAFAGQYLGVGKATFALHLFDDLEAIRPDMITSNITGSGGCWHRDSHPSSPS
jgi:hypothetical protein